MCTCTSSKELPTYFRTKIDTVQYLFPEVQHRYTYTYTYVYSCTRKSHVRVTYVYKRVLREVQRCVNVVHVLLYTYVRVQLYTYFRKYESTSVLESPGFGFGLRPLHVQYVVQYCTCTRTTDNALPSKVFYFRKYIQ